MDAKGYTIPLILALLVGLAVFAVLSVNNGDTLPDYGGNAGRFLAVNADETTLVYSHGEPGIMPPFNVEVYRGDTSTCIGMTAPVDGEYALGTYSLTPPTGWAEEPPPVEGTTFVRCRSTGRVSPSSDSDADGVVGVSWFAPVLD